MSEFKENSDAFLHDSGHSTTPEYEAWFRKQVMQTLEKEKRGEMEYISLEDIKREFNCNAD